MSGTGPMSQDRALRYLTGTLDYTWDEAVNAVNGAPATETSTYQLARHQVRWDYPGVYVITEAPDPRKTGCCHEPEGRETVLAPGYEPGPGEYESWYPHLASGHKLSRDQIARHGRDRYPTPGAQYAKVLDELGELGEALISWAGTEAPECFARVRAEYADAGLALYALGDKLGLDLIQCMADLVAGDTRSFAVAPICGTCGTCCGGGGACPGPVTVWKGSREDETGERP